MNDAAITAQWLSDHSESLTAAAKALGVDRRNIHRHKAGSHPLTRERRLAMAAIAANLKPYGDTDNEQ